VTGVVAGSLAWLLAACSVAPGTVISYEGGRRTTTYLTNAYSAHGITADGRIGVFVVGQTSVANAARVTITFYNLSDEAMDMVLDPVLEKGAPIVTLPNAGRLPAGGTLQVRLPRFRLWAYAWPDFIVSFRAGDTSYRERFVARQHEFDSYWEAIINDPSAPASVDEFEQISVKPRRCLCLEI
jgi:hypothetical protein